MTNATESMREKREREQDERSLHNTMQRFAKKWNPDQCRRVK